MLPVTALFGYTGTNTVSWRASSKELVAPNASVSIQSRNVPYPYAGELSHAGAISRGT